MGNEKPWAYELLSWVTACQSAYHIDSTPNHRFGGMGSNLEENRAAVVEYVGDLISEKDAEADRLRAELAIAEKDAARYRWMRNERGSWPGIVAGEELDNMVDVGLSRHA